MVHNLGIEKELVYTKVKVRGKAVELLLKCVHTNLFVFFMHFCLRTITTHPESEAWTGQTFTIHTTLNTEQNQLAIKVSADN